MIFDLPWPPTVNHYWHTRADGRGKFLSADAKVYRKTCAVLLMQAKAKQLSGRVQISIFAHPPDKRRRDLDNILKPILDALEGHCFEDDSQVHRLAIERREPLPNGRLILQISPY